MKSEDPGFYSFFCLYALPLDVLEGLTPPTALPFFQAVDAFKCEIIEHALRETHGEVPAAAAQLGLSRSQMYALIEEFNLKRLLRPQIGFPNDKCHSVNKLKGVVEHQLF